MTIFFLITALLVIPAGFLIVIGDEVNPLEEARRVVAKNAKKSDDRTAVRTRLEELGKGSDKDYEEFRIKQYGYSAASSSVALVLLFLLSHSIAFNTWYGFSGDNDVCTAGSRLN